jgi:hypothetical protein
VRASLWTIGLDTWMFFYLTFVNHSHTASLISSLPVTFAFLFIQPFPCSHLFIILSFCLSVLYTLILPHLNRVIISHTESLWFGHDVKNKLNGLLKFGLLKFLDLYLGLIRYLNSERTVKQNFSSNLLEFAPSLLSLSIRLFLNFCDK